MSADNGGLGFKIVASQKRGSSHGDRDKGTGNDQHAMYYAEKIQDGPLYVQPLNANNCPSGEKRFLTFDSFIEQFRPEPLFYYNKVKPVMDLRDKNLEKGEAALESQQYEKAENAYKQVLAMDEENITGTFGLGLAYLGAGKEAEAQLILGKLMELDLAFGSEHKHMFNRFGIQMRKSRMHDQAIAYYKKAITLNPSDEHLHFNLARVYFDTEVFAACHASLVDALDRNPGFQEGMEFLKFVVANHRDLIQDQNVSVVVENVPDSVRYPELDLEGAPWLA